MSYKRIIGLLIIISLIFTGCAGGGESVDKNNSSSNRSTLEKSVNDKSDGESESSDVDSVSGPTEKNKNDETKGE